MQNTDICTNWIYKPTGEKINWICKLHSVVVIGYNKNKVFVSDSYTGNIESYNRKQLEKIYNLYGKRAIYYPNWHKKYIKNMMEEKNDKYLQKII